MLLVAHKDVSLDVRNLACVRFPLPIHNILDLCFQISTQRLSRTVMQRSPSTLTVRRLSSERCCITIQFLLSARGSPRTNFSSHALVFQYLRMHPSLLVVSSLTSHSLFHRPLYFAYIRVSASCRWASLRKQWQRSPSG